MKSKPDWHEYAGPEGFWGYGSEWKDADIIFIGPEFGGSCVEKRIDYWEGTDREQFTDLSPFMEALDKDNKFVKEGTLSGKRGIKTFGSLMVILMGAKPTVLRKCYAKHCFGLSDLNTKISWSDLSALPCKNLTNEEFEKEYRIDRKTYNDAYLPARVEHLKRFFDKSRNKTVILYGASERVKPIFNGNWREVSLDEHFHCFDVLRNGSHNVIRVAHPCAHHATNTYFEECGRRIGILDPKKYEAEAAAKIARD